MIGYDVFGNKSDITVYGVIDGEYKKIFFLDVAEKILELGNKPLLVRDFIHEVCFDSKFGRSELYSALLHIAYFIDGEFREEIRAYIESENPVRIFEGITGEEKDIKNIVNVERLKKECSAVLNIYKYMDA